MAWPAGTSLFRRLTATSKEARVRVAVACSADWPRTGGTGRGSGPWEMTSSTSDPSRAVVDRSCPSTRWKMTLSLGTFSS
jgi:hypothetical protein